MLSSRCCDACAISSIASSNAASCRGEGFWKPLTFLTNWRAAARISSSGAITLAWRRVLMLRHIPDKNTEVMERSPLSPSEQSWVATNLEIAAELARAYTGDTEAPPALQRLDATWMGWQEDPDQAKTDANTVVNALGIALGSHLIDALGLGWMVITDQYGTELAVYG